LLPKLIQNLLTAPRFHLGHRLLPDQLAAAIQVGVPPPGVQPVISNPVAPRFGDVTHQPSLKFVDRQFHDLALLGAAVGGSIILVPGKPGTLPGFSVAICLNREIWEVSLISPHFPAFPPKVARLTRRFLGRVEPRVGIFITGN